MFFYIVQFLGYTALGIWIDYKRIHSFRGKDSNQKTVESPLLDEAPDVLAHKQHVNQVWENYSDQYPIKAKNLQKIYKNGVCAVNNNSFVVKKGEVLGLLGPNGAGKSSTFGVMTLDFKRTEGEGKLMDNMLDDVQVSEHGNKMGMCPQFNPLWKYLSVDQCLRYIGRVKGLTDEELDYQIEFIK